MSDEAASEKVQEGEEEDEEEAGPSSCDGARMSRVDRLLRDSAVRVAPCVAMRAFPDCRALSPGRRHTD